MSDHQSSIYEAALGSIYVALTGDMRQVLFLLAESGPMKAIEAARQLGRASSGCGDWLYALNARKLVTRQFITEGNRPYRITELGFEVVRYARELQKL
ncbi:hypothetical protein A3K63_02710 [Candidatus Micrarchaeota archaeon RBG_16_49_10]|nr:MAG: hypothetical protein A3K63_02710 [Candidatus Micrarchaeota archaeon RBG_16_49_10]